MSQRNLERFPSVVFAFHDDADVNDDDNNRNDHVQTNDDNHTISTQYFTPMAVASQVKTQSQNITSTVTTTNQLLVSPVRISTPSPRRPAIKRRAQSVTPSSGTTQQDIEIINLITPPKASTLTVTTTQRNYTIRTMTIYNQRRRSILPTFPSTMPYYNHEHDLLLANVPMNLLSTQELACRQPNFYPAPFTIINPRPISGSIMMKEYNKYFSSILERFKLDLSILDHNYFRLYHFMHLFCSSRIRQIGQEKCQDDLYPLADVEIPQLFEFYLQMDVDLFYMKTCSYRGAQPRSIHEGIFCLEPPQCLYAMSKCNQCELCTPLNSNVSSVLFEHFSKHRFVNGYESILNCPVDCNTKNFIYVLTCPCNQFDYICETKFTLGRRLQDHHQLVNNLICKLILGKENFKTLPFNKEVTSLLLRKETMQLYQHTSQCSIAIQLFLDANPSYWPFIPMTTAEANQATTDIFYTNRNESLTKFLNNIPVPPHGFKFSKRQIEQQSQWFQKNQMVTSINDHVNIYQAAIIAVLPPNTSDLLRHMVHALFVTHTEAKLNTLGHVFDFPEYHTIRTGVWCANLKRPPNFVLI